MFSSVSAAQEAQPRAAVAAAVVAKERADVEAANYDEDTVRRFFRNFIPMRNAACTLRLLSRFLIDATDVKILLYRTSGLLNQ